MAKKWAKDEDFAKVSVRKHPPCPTGKNKTARTSASGGFVFRLRPLQNLSFEHGSKQWHRKTRRQY